MSIERIIDENTPKLIFDVYPVDEEYLDDVQNIDMYEVRDDKEILVGSATCESDMLADINTAAEKLKSLYLDSNIRRLRKDPNRGGADPKVTKSPKMGSGSKKRLATGGIVSSGGGASSILINSTSPPLSSSRLSKEDLIRIMSYGGKSAYDR